MAMLSVNNAVLSLHNIRGAERGVTAPFPAGEGEWVLPLVGVPLVVGVRGILAGVRLGVVAIAMAGERARAAGGDSEEDSAGEATEGDDTPWGVRGVDGRLVVVSGFLEGLFKCTTDIVRTCRLVLDTTDGARFSGDTEPGGRLW